MASYNYFMSNINQLFKRLNSPQALISCNTLTSEFRTPNDLISLIPSDSKYHVIPLGNTQSTYINPWLIAEGILQLGLSNNKVLDVTMPYKTHEGRDKRAALARFIFHNNKLLGIRTELKDRGDRRVVVNCQIHQCLSKYQDNTQIPQGEFYLHLNNSKIALLFESEIVSYVSILEEYAKMGCEVFSIVSNLPFASQKGDIQDKIKEFSSNYHRLVIYSSMFYAPTDKDLYTGGSYIQFNKQIIKESQISIYEESECLKANVNLGKLQQMTDYSKLGEYSYQHIKDIHIEHYLLSAKADATSSKEMEAEGNFVVKSENLQQYHIWHLFKKVNKRSPFFVSRRWDEPTRALVNGINRIALDIEKHQIKVFFSLKPSYTLTLRKLLVLYCYDQSTHQNDSLWTQVTVGLGSTVISLGGEGEITSKELKQRYQNLLLERDKDQRIFFYTANEKEILAIEDLIERGKDHRIGLCRNIEWLQKDKRAVPAAASASEKESEETKTERVVEEILRRSTYQKEVYSRIFNSFRPEQIRHIYTSVIPKVLKLNIANTPFYDYFANNDWETHKFEHSAFQKDISSFIKKYSANDKLLQDKVSLIKKLKKEKKVSCHICDQLFPVEEKLTVDCPCGNTFCYDCLTIHKSLPSGDLNRNCLVCQKKCHCQRCSKKEAHQFANYCHKCDEKAGLKTGLPFLYERKTEKFPTIECSDPCCKVSFCIKCINEIDNCPKLLVTSTSEWKCLVCRKMCNCPPCAAQAQIEKGDRDRITQDNHEREVELERTIENAQKNALSKPSVQVKDIPQVIKKVSSQAARNIFDMDDNKSAGSIGSTGKRNHNDDRNKSRSRSRDRKGRQSIEMRPQRNSQRDREWTNNRGDSRHNEGFRTNYNNNRNDSRNGYTSNSRENYNRGNNNGSKAFEERGPSRDHNEGGFNGDNKDMIEGWGNNINNNENSQTHDRVDPRTKFNRNNGQSGNRQDFSNRGDHSTGRNEEQHNRGQRPVSSQAKLNMLIEIKTSNPEIDY